jgi:hypothetical protein
VKVRKVRRVEKRCCLIFVYNADSSLYAQLTDAAHKVLSPDTYQCNLCKITYSAVVMKKEWKEYVQTLPFQTQFLHRDEFRKEFPTLNQVLLPVILLGEKSEVSLLISAEELNAQSSLPGLMKLLNTKIV